MSIWDFDAPLVVNHAFNAASRGKLSALKDEVAKSGIDCIGNSYSLFITTI